MPTFLSVPRAARELGFTERKVRDLMRAGLLEAVDAELGTSGRHCRWITTESLERYEQQARRAGEFALGLCSRCGGIRYVLPGTDYCNVCTDVIEERRVERAEARKVRKREWWRANGSAWRARKATQQEGHP